MNIMWLLISLILLAQTEAPVTPADAPAASNTAVTADDNSGPNTGPANSSAVTASAGTVDTNSAASGAAAEPQRGWFSDMLHSGALGYILDGGLFMWPILLLGVLALGVTIERFRALMMFNTRAESLRSRVRRLLEADQVEEAVELCDREQGPVPAILGAGLRQYVVSRRLNDDPAKIKDQVIKGMDDYSVHIIAAMEKHLPILATVASAAPMLGFLGTVAGMIVAFDQIVQGAGEQNIVVLAAAGIKVSLLTTAFGLIVGLPSYVAFNYFTSVVNQFVLDVEETAAELIEAVTFQLALSGRNGAATPERLEQHV
jgi:biopolymer transport protein ExbB